LFRAARLGREALGDSFDIKVFMRKAVELDWSVEAPLWENILVLGRNRILAKKSNYDDAALIIHWLCLGKSLPNHEVVKRHVQNRWEIANPDSPFPGAS
jgi:hypothetical protein